MEIMAQTKKHKTASHLLANYNWVSVFSDTTFNSRLDKCPKPLDQVRSKNNCQVRMLHEVHFMAQHVL